MAAFQADLPETLKQAAEASETDTIRVFVQDESRFGLLPAVTRRITRAGVKPIQPVQHRFESLSLYGAVEPTTGEHVFLELSALDSECFQIFLEHFAAEYAKSVCLMMLDNGAFHKAKRLVLPKNIVFLFLPPYAPELNPIERLWQDIKEQITFSLFETLESLKDAVAEILKRYSVHTIASLTGYRYLVEAVYALSN